MESTRPIRALKRGLDALTVLNLRNGATVSEIAQQIKLPRTTTYRILETLSNAGYVYRDAKDDRYRLTIMVRGLADGFDDETWVTLSARPYLYALGKDIIWPVAICSLSGTQMLLRETTDHRSPLAIERIPAGVRVPLLTSASGRVYLAYCPQNHRDSLLDILARSDQPEDALARNRPAVLEMLNEVRTQGYAVAVRARRLADGLSLAVPIMIEERVLAVVATRWSSGAVPLRLAIERFLPKLLDTALKIRQSFLDEQLEAPLAPERLAHVR